MDENQEDKYRSEHAIELKDNVLHWFKLILYAIQVWF